MPPGDLNLLMKKANIVAFTSLIARLWILLGWKSQAPPSVGLWLKDIMGFLKLEKIEFSVRGSTAKFFFHLAKKNDLC